MESTKYSSYMYTTKSEGLYAVVTLMETLKENEQKATPNRPKGHDFNRRALRTLTLKKLQHRDIYRSKEIEIELAASSGRPQAVTNIWAQCLKSSGGVWPEAICGSIAMRECNKHEIILASASRNGENASRKTSSMLVKCSLRRGYLVSYNIKHRPKRNQSNRNVINESWHFSVCRGKEKPASKIYYVTVMKRRWNAVARGVSYYFKRRNSDIIRW